MLPGRSVHDCLSEIRLEEPLDRLMIRGLEVGLGTSNAAVRGREPGGCESKFKGISHESLISRRLAGAGGCSPRLGECKCGL